MTAYGIFVDGATALGCGLALLCLLFISLEAVARLRARWDRHQAERALIAALEERADYEAEEARTWFVAYMRELKANGWLKARVRLLECRLADLQRKAARREFH